MVLVGGVSLEVLLPVSVALDFSYVFKLLLTGLFVNGLNLSHLSFLSIDFLETLLLIEICNWTQYHSETISWRFGIERIFIFRLIIKYDHLIIVIAIRLCRFEVLNCLIMRIVVIVEFTSLILSISLRRVLSVFKF